MSPARHPVRALVLAPTRELAAQIGESFGTYGRFSGLASTPPSADRADLETLTW